MNMNYSGEKYIFRRAPNRSNPYRVLGLLVLILIGVFVYREFDQGRIVSPYAATPTPTRTIASLAMEAETHFIAGDLESAISAYQRAAQSQPNDASIWTEMARIQTYYSSLKTTDALRKQTLEEALAAADRAVELAPEDSMVHAVRAFVLDWYAQPVYVGVEEATRLLNEAEAEAVRALQLDNTNALALAYYAEILVDQQKWTQADQYIRQALERDPNLMDVHRVNAYVNESLANYGVAISEYEEAARITPNFTYLYLRIGANLRQLKQNDRALEYFSKAVDINNQIGVLDPTPYLAIARTYSQMGEFFAAARNVRKAIEIDPTSPDIYGQLGLVYFRGRNYESAIPALKCAIRGCSAAESCEVRQCDEATDPQIEIEGMPMNDNTLVYYYTYGSVLAGMHRPNNNYCAEAMKVLGEVRAVYGNDVTVVQIIEPSEAICADLTGQSASTTLPTANPDQTITPAPQTTTVPTATTTVEN